MKRILLCAGVLMLGFGKVQAEALKVGDPAPNFTAAASDGSQIELKSVTGKAPIVLYFYPKDDTPGCTKEACSLRDNIQELKKVAEVVGVSADTIESHQKFVEKYGLPFTLLADPEKKIIDAYGADGL